LFCFSFAFPLYLSKAHRARSRGYSGG